MNQNLEKLVESRTKEIRLKNEQLMRYSYDNAHKVRGPLARIMGLVYLAKIDKTTDPSEIIDIINQESNDMDEIVRSISAELDESINKTE